MTQDELGIPALERRHILTEAAARHAYTPTSSRGSIGSMPCQLSASQAMPRSIRSASTRSSSRGTIAGVSLFYLARLLGSSVDQVDKTYGHLLPDSEEYLRGLLDAFDVVELDQVEQSR